MPKKREWTVEGRRKAAKRGQNVRRSTRASEPKLEIWIPPKRTTAKAIDRAMERAGKNFSGTALKINSDVPTSDLFIAPSQSKLTNRELGFDQKGKCLYGCDGMRSIKKGYTNIAMHHYQCPFWETVDGKTKTPF